ncbi:MAG: tRNA (adenosine(37)-N6)-threonylcarbamoyltransferase complex ATPase subunit type 1 TsaE [Nitriliruptoraceae bacterium]
MTPSSTPLRLRAASPDDTREIAGAVAAAIKPGDVVVLSGELGAGKTCFVQGAAAALGVTTRVPSPTFMLVRTYPTARVPIVHCDVYRLDRLHDVLDLGDDVFASDVVTFVEWGDAIDPLLPDDRLEVEIVLADAASPDADRLIELRPHGRWVDDVQAIRMACAGWDTGEVG